MTFLFFCHPPNPHGHGCCQTYKTFIITALEAEKLAKQKSPIFCGTPCSFAPGEPWVYKEWPQGQDIAGWTTWENWEKTAKKKLKEETEGGWSVRQNKKIIS